jgi:hypothetical protein
MAEFSNPFDLLNDVDESEISGSEESELDTSGDLKTDIPAEPKIEPIENSRGLWGAQGPIAWADMEDDPLDEFGCDDSKESEAEKEQVIVAKKEIPTATSQADLEWAMKRNISVTHDVRFYDKEKNELTVQQNIRQLTVIKKRDYDKLKSLIERTRTHRGVNKDVFDRYNQESKIKLANSLLGMCYKDPRQPCTFVYPIARIHMRNGEGQTRILTRNEVYKASKCYFEIGDIVCEMGPLCSP